MSTVSDGNDSKRMPWWKRYDSSEIGEKRHDYTLRAGKVMREARESVPMYQSEMASDIGLKDKSLSAYERGYVDIPYSNLPMVLETAHYHVSKAVRELFPSQDDEFKECRNRLLEIMIDRGMDVTPLSPLYPAGTLTKPKWIPGVEDSTRRQFFASTYTSSENDAYSSESYPVVHDDPSIAALDFLTLSNLALGEKRSAEKEAFQKTLLECVFYYWANQDRRTFEYHEFWDTIKEKQEDKRRN